MQMAIMVKYRTGELVSNPELQDAGSRLLGEWMTVDAAPVLLDLAKTAAEEKYEIRAIRDTLLPLARSGPRRGPS